MKNSNSLLKTLSATAIAGFMAFGFTSTAFAAEAVNLDSLMDQVRQGRALDSQDNSARLAEFRSDRNKQAALLSTANGQQRAQENESARLNGVFEVNDGEIIELNIRLDERLGDLKELFGVLQQASGDAKAGFDSSITSVQFPERDAYMADIMTKMGQTSKFASEVKLSSFGLR